METEAEKAPGVMGGFVVGWDMQSTPSMPAVDKVQEAAAQALRGASMTNCKRRRR